VDESGSYAVAAYDRLGRPTGETVWAPDAAYGHAFSMTYDDLGQIETRTYPTGRVVEWERNAKGFLTRIRTADGSYATGLSWDPAGRLASWVAGNGVSWNAAFESETGLLESIRVTGSTGSTIEHRRYGFDPADRIEQIQDWVRSGADQAFDYDPGGRLEWAEGPYGEAGAAATLRYGFDTAANMTCLAGASLPDCSGGTTATFPPLGAPHQPSAIGGAAAAHDALGNLRALGVAREYTYTDVGQLETVKHNGVEVARFRYDADSRLASIASQSGPDRLLVTPDFEWDTDNRVGRIVIRLGGSVIAVHDDAYDPQPSGGSCAGAGPVLPIDGEPWALLWLFAPGLAATALAWMLLRGQPRLRVHGFRWIRSGGTLVLCIAITTNGFACPGGTTHALSPPSVTYFFQDHLGSTIVVADSAGGTTSSFYRPFGQRVGAGSPPEYGYNGQRFQSDSGLYHYGARWYDPALGRFLQPDSILPSLDEPGSLNPYGYVLYDPVNLVDPTGMFQQDAIPDANLFSGFPGTVIPDDQLGGIYAGTSFIISNGETSGFPPAGEPIFGWPFQQQSVVPAGNLTLEWVGRTIASQSESTDHGIYIGAKHRGSEIDGKVGHAFLALEAPGSDPVTYGFWPAESVSFDSKGALQTVPGAVLRNDFSDREYFGAALAGEEGFAVVRYPITRTNYDAALSAIQSYEGRSYSALGCNCTHFVVDVGRAAGVDVPWAGIVPRPSVLRPNLE
jgi:RHS repeat-associated protein